jgi:hypothetical protein
MKIIRLRVGSVLFLPRVSSFLLLFIFGGASLDVNNVKVSSTAGTTKQQYKNNNNRGAPDIRGQHLNKSRRGTSRPTVSIF